MKTWTFAAVIIAWTFGMGAGWLSHNIVTNSSRTLLSVALAKCGYTPHPIADVAWELVRIGAIPPMTAAFYSARMTSANSHNGLKACMGPHYGG